jgi:hypothetical protein
MGRFMQGTPKVQAVSDWAVYNLSFYNHLLRLANHSF